MSETDRQRDDVLAASVPLANLLDEGRITSIQWRTVFLCACVTLVDGFDLQLASLVVPTVAQEWNISSSSFGGVLSAGILGLALAAAFIAPLGDKFGRRPVIILGFLVVALGSLATATSTNLTELLIWRFVTGLGLGASLPNATALTAEFTPARIRSRLLVAMYACTGVGAILAGFTAPAIMAATDWQTLFIVGGVIPLVGSALLFWKLPESLPFLYIRNPRHPALQVTLKAIRPDLDIANLTHTDGERKKVGVKQVLSSRYRAATLLLWVVYFLATFVLYVLLSWLPTLLRAAGWSSSGAIMGAVTLSIGGVVAGIGQGWLADRGWAVPALLGGFVTTALALIAFTFVPSSFGAWIPLIVLAGFGSSGGVFALSALSARLYPPEIRAAGVGFASAIARVGAVVAPLAGSLLLALGLGPSEILLSLVAPMAACVIVLMFFSSRWRPV
jgi:AAHS family 4-hydroxybenzoate transporter-like MFS transporter